MFTINVNSIYVRYNSFPMGPFNFDIQIKTEYMQRFSLTNKLEMIKVKWKRQHQLLYLKALLTEYFGGKKDAFG